MDTWTVNVKRSLTSSKVNVHNNKSMLSDRKHEYVIIKSEKMRAMTEKSL